MAIFIDEKDIGTAWLAAYEALQETGQAVNLSVAIAHPLHEDVGVRRAIERRLVELQAAGTSNFANPQSMHTVANTIFPIGLYRPGRDGAASRFMANVHRNEGLRASSRSRRWGTYIGRLTAYPSQDGSTTNQLELILKTLNAGRKYVDTYEMPIVAPDVDLGSPGHLTSGAVLHGDVGFDTLKRGGPCLAHISLTSSRDGALSMVALYRAHVYETRAYGNFLGLARLLAFLAAESGRDVGQLLVVTGHAYSAAPGRATLLAAACAAAGTVTPIEISARRLGATMRDLDLPTVLR